ncbi:hypothetical protein [Streptomyces chartreusis]|uniref:hypothetical protein n=1 Tax=Streptomyces chartreusis TaxID=1969 RepID=UPI003640F70A
MTTDSYLCSGLRMRLRPGPTGSTGEEYLTVPGHAPDMLLGFPAPAQPLGSGAAAREGQRHS